MAARKKLQRMDPQLMDDEFANFIEAGDRLKPVQVRLITKNIRIELERMAELECTKIDSAAGDSDEEYLYAMLERRIEKAIPRVFGMLAERLYETKAFLKREERERDFV